MKCASLVWLAALGAAALARADEGMWLFSAPPTAQIKARYSFDLTQPWLDHLMRASVRFDNGGSGSFVSADGLAITNHHVGLDELQKMSTSGKDYVKGGFYARAPAEEVKCLDLELNVLQSTEDVTARINAAIPAGVSASDAAKARQRIIAEIEKDSESKTGLRSDVVTLYEGGAYHLYRYKRYTDVRLVFAPEQQAAFFGGDPDNFEYPRYDVDICIFRVYENGQPIHPTDYLQWSTTGAQDGELVFISGNPGRTERFLTVAEMEFMRDTEFPTIMDKLFRREALLSAWSARSEENARRANDYFFSIQNSRKVYGGMLAALQDGAFMGAKEMAENGFKALLRSRFDAGPALQAYERIASAQKVIARNYLRGRFLEFGAGFDSDLFRVARTLLRAGDERPKANGDRLKEFADARRESLELDLFSERPIYDDLEILTLTDSLTELVSTLGYSDSTVQEVLDGHSPHDRATDLVLHTRVKDVAFRHKLYDGGLSAVRAAHDPMIELARSIDNEARFLRRADEAQQEIKEEAHALIEQARYALKGNTSYPDATFTLRLGYGSVRGYEQDGVHIPFHTVYSGLFARSDEHHDKPPFDLTALWQRSRDAIDPNVAVDSVSTCDSTGGNSGSPMVNQAGQFVGILFDGNIQSLSTDFAYTETQSRSVQVDSAGILEALRKVYRIDALANELVTGHR